MNNNRVLNCESIESNDADHLTKALEARDALVKEIDGDDIGAVKKPLFVMRQGWDGFDE